MRAAMSLADTVVLAITFYLFSAQSCQVLKGDRTVIRANKETKAPEVKRVLRV